MSEEEQTSAQAEGTYNANSFDNQRDLEHEITFALIFNWFIGWPILFIIFSILTYTISKNYVTEPFIVSLI